MKHKRGILIICLIICLFSIASVCASDVNETVVANENMALDILSMDEQDNDLSVEGNDEISKFSNDSKIINVPENEEFYSAVNTSESLALSDTLKFHLQVQ